jgi:hypothetical protein
VNRQDAETVEILCSISSRIVADGQAACNRSRTRRRPHQSNRRGVRRNDCVLAMPHIDAAPGAKPLKESGEATFVRYCRCAGMAL